MTLREKALLLYQQEQQFKKAKLERTMAQVAERFKHLLKEKLDLDLEPSTDTITVEGMTLYFRWDWIEASIACENCGKEIQSREIFNLHDLGAFLSGVHRNHHCRQEVTVEETFMRLLKELIQKEVG